VDRRENGAAAVSESSALGSPTRGEATRPGLTSWHAPTPRSSRRGSARPSPSPPSTSCSSFVIDASVERGRWGRWGRWGRSVTPPFSGRPSDDRLRTDLRPIPRRPIGASPSSPSSPLGKLARKSGTVAPFRIVPRASPLGSDGRIATRERPNRRRAASTSAESALEVLRAALSRVKAAVSRVKFDSSRPGAPLSRVTAALCRVKGAPRPQGAPFSGLTAPSSPRRAPSIDQRVDVRGQRSTFWSQDGAPRPQRAALWSQAAAP
jgi:hypothetical protein